MEPIDHMKALKADERKSLTTNRRNINGLAEAREHQRADREKAEQLAKEQARLALYEAVRSATGTQAEIAKRFNLHQPTVSLIKRGLLG